MNIQKYNFFFSKMCTLKMKIKMHLAGKTIATATKIKLK
jgi:hypothetical protein